MGERGGCRRCGVLRQLAAFDEMTGIDGLTRPAYEELAEWLGQGPTRHPAAAPARGGTSVPPHRHHLRGLRRGRSHRAPDPVRRRPARSGGRRMGDACKRGLEQRAKAINLYINDIYSQARGAARRHRAGGARVPESGVPAGDERPARPARHLRAHRGHRHRARGRRQLLRARGQCPHALRRLLHAGEPRDHVAAVSPTCSHAIASRRSRTIRTSCWRR